MPAVGFGVGLERLLLLMESQKIDIPKPKSCDVFIAAIGEEANLKSFELAKTLRENSFYVELDVEQRGLKAQLKYANKINAQFCLVIGDSELEKGMAELKDMNSGEKFEVSLEYERFVEIFSRLFGARN